jgi:hypothetical protein
MEVRWFLHLSKMKGISCFLLVNILLVNLYAQQSSLDSIAIKIQTHINKNKVQLNQGKYVFSKLNDSLYLGTGIEFINQLEFDRTKLKDYFEYNLLLINDPITDTAIVDIYKGYNLNESVFPQPPISGDFSGGFKRHSELLRSYILNSGVTISDSLEFRVYFKKETPFNAFYVESHDASVSQLVINFYNTIAKCKYHPPINYGRPQFSSHLFKFSLIDTQKYSEAYEEYESIVISDNYIYSLSRWRERNTKQSILVFDNKRKLEDILSDKFLNHFASEHHAPIRELLSVLYESIGRCSELLKINIISK